MNALNNILDKIKKDCSLKVVFRAESEKLWDKSLNELDYVSYYYTNEFLNFQSQIVSNQTHEYLDISMMFFLDNKFVLGGSADLAASTKQIISDESYTSKNRSGQNIEFGIREHSMAAVVNGISLHSNLFAFGSTFLVLLLRGQSS